LFYGSVSGNEQKESLAGANSRLSIDTVRLCDKQYQYTSAFCVK